MKQKSLKSGSLENYFWGSGTPVNHSQSLHVQVEKTWNRGKLSQERPINQHQNLPRLIQENTDKHLKNCRPWFDHCQHSQCDWQKAITCTDGWSQMVFWNLNLKALWQHTHTHTDKGRLSMRSENMWPCYLKPLGGKLCLCCWWWFSTPCVKMWSHHIQTILKQTPKQCPHTTADNKTQFLDCFHTWTQKLSICRKIFIPHIKTDHGIQTCNLSLGSRGRPTRL